jgi:hypothetical protein
MLTRYKNRSRPLSVKQPGPALPDWSKLSRGDAVRITRKDGTTVCGRIDMISIERTVLWVIQDGGLGRVMILDADKPRITKVCAVQN